MDNSTSSKASRQVPLRLSVHTNGETPQKRSFWTLFPNSMPFKQLRPPHPLFILTYNLSSPNTNSIFDNPQGLPPSHGPHDHSIPLVPGSLPPNVLPYHHPFSQKNEIEKIVQELLVVGVIILVPALILLPSSWYSRKKVCGACALIFDPSTKLPSKINFPFPSLMTFWMN
jgi:hypothetical protein